MTRLELPALRANDSLGVLAALGLLEVCTSGLRVEARLGWSGPDGIAILNAPFADLPEFAAGLGAYAADLSKAGRLTPAHDPALITPRLTKAQKAAMTEPGRPDTMRLDQETAIARYQMAQDRELMGELAPDSHWLTALVGPLSFADRQRVKCRLTPLYSPSAQMTMWQLYRDALKDVVQRTTAFAETLVGWRRIPGTGANLDGRALIDAAAAARGEPANRYAPGPTWLALQSAPWFTQVGDGVAGEAVGWRYPSGGARLRYPVWTSLLGPAAVRVVLSHPAVRWQGPAQLTQRARARAAQERRTLGVCALYEARRRALGNSAGPLLPPELLWRA